MELKSLLSVPHHGIHCTSSHLAKPARVLLIVMSDTLPPATTSPISLERRNSLEKAISNRPEAHELREKHILLNTNAAPYEVILTG
jgi:hypothetical protein